MKRPEIIPQCAFSHKFDLPDFSLTNRHIPMTLQGKKRLLKWFQQTGIHKLIIQNGFIGVQLFTYPETAEFLSKNLSIPRKNIQDWPETDNDTKFDEGEAFRLKVHIDESDSERYISIDFNFLVRDRCTITDCSILEDSDSNSKTPSVLPELYEALKVRLNDIQTIENTFCTWEAGIIRCIDLLNLIKTKLG